MTGFRVDRHGLSRSIAAFPQICSAICHGCTNATFCSSSQSSVMPRTQQDKNLGCLPIKTYRSCSYSKTFDAIGSEHGRDQLPRSSLLHWLISPPDKAKKIVLQSSLWVMQAELVAQFLCCIPLAAIEAVLSWLKPAIPQEEQDHLLSQVRPPVSGSTLKGPLLHTGKSQNQCSMQSLVLLLQSTCSLVFMTTQCLRNYQLQGKMRSLFMWEHTSAHQALDICPRG